MPDDVPIGVDPAPLDERTPDRAEAELERRYRLTSYGVTDGPGDPEGVTADVLAWRRAADKRRRQLILATPTVHVTEVEPSERREERLRKPGPPR
jgi:hypothetical protein